MSSIHRLLIIAALLSGTGFGQLQPNPTADSPAVLYAEAQEFVQAEDWPGAIERLSEVLRLDPEHTPSRFYLAVSYTGLDQNDRAIEIYRDILAGDPTVFEARMNLAALLFEGGRAEDAVEEFQRASRLRPGDPTPRFYRAQIFEQLERREDALAAYREVIALDRAEHALIPEAYRRLGHLNLANDQIEEAGRMFSEALDRGLQHPSVFQALGDLASRRGDLQTARGHYADAIELDPESTELRLRLAITLRDLGELDGAIRLLENLPGEDALLAEVYLARGRWVDAIPVYERLRRSEPSNADYWYGLGRSRYELDQYDQAIPLLEQTVALDPERYEALGALASIYYRRENWVRARDGLVRYLELRPNHTASLFLLATCYDYLGDYEQALLNYNLFIQFDDGSDDARSFQVRQRAQSLERLLQDRE